MATIKQCYDALYLHESTFRDLGVHAISVEEESKNNFVIVLWFDGVIPEVPTEVISPKGVAVKVDTRQEERFRPE